MIPGVINGKEVKDIGPYTCFDRKSLLLKQFVQDGWTPDGRKNMIEIEFKTTTNCKYAEHGFAVEDVRCYREGRICSHTECCK